jgi:hypothetical protein
MCSFAPFAVDVVALRPTYTCPKPPFPSFLSTMYTGEPPTCVCVLSLQKKKKEDKVRESLFSRRRDQIQTERRRRRLRRRNEYKHKQTNLLWNRRGGAVLVRLRVFAIVRRIFRHFMCYLYIIYVCEYESARSLYLRDLSFTGGILSSRSVVLFWIDRKKASCACVLSLRRVCSSRACVLVVRRRTKKV